jgi:hypothetical protein
MRKELDEALCKKYPEIFQDRHGDMTKTAMCWGFDCGDGWYHIIDAACAQIKNHLWNNEQRLKTKQDHIENHKKAIAGDFSFLDEKINKSKNLDWYEKNPQYIEHEKQYYLNSIPPWMEDLEEIPPVVAVQIKEKFGTLRFYYDGGDEYIAGVLSMAESMSARTCEQCGSLGTARGGGWIRTLCDKHAQEMGYNTGIEEAWE